jgi:hypothetical protein
MPKTIKIDFFKGAMLDYAGNFETLLRHIGQIPLQNETRTRKIFDAARERVSPVSGVIKWRSAYDVSVDDKDSQR